MTQPSQTSSEYGAEARSVGGGKIVNGEFQGDWYVYWWRKDGRMHGSRGMGLSLAAANRLAREIRDGEVTP